MIEDFCLFVCLFLRSNCVLPLILFDWFNNHGRLSSVRIIFEWKQSTPLHPRRLLLIAAVQNENVLMKFLLVLRLQAVINRTH